MRVTTTLAHSAATGLAVVAAAVLLVSFSPRESIADKAFDHLTTGFRLEGAHRFAECESCHIKGVFDGTPKQCASCHTQASRIQATFQPATHLPVSKRCDSCHRPFSWAPAARFDHLEVRSTCSSCHNNRIVAGQHPQHAPTTQECDSCHNTRSFR